jgi:hypothetical protein
VTPQKNVEAWPSLPIKTDVNEDIQYPMSGPIEYVVQSPESSLDTTLQTDYAPARYNTRLQDEANLDVMTKATSLSRKRNLEGNHDLIPDPMASNSFVVLSDNQIFTIANMMGVRIPNDDFSHVNLLRELEDARNSLSFKNAPKSSIASTLFIENSLGDSTPLSMDWASSFDNDDAPLL